MAKAATDKKQKRKPSKADQYERFRQTAREHGVDNEESAQEFERAFRKIVPPKSRRAAR
jgi:hypothetical protein